jgi:hypothetical protein
MVPTPNRWTEEEDEDDEEIPEAAGAGPKEIAPLATQLRILKETEIETKSAVIS